MTGTRVGGDVLPEIRALTEAASDIVGALDLDEQMRRVARRARRLVSADFAAVATVESTGRSTWHAVDGAVSTAWATTDFPEGRGTAGRVVVANAPVIVTGFPDNPAFPADEFPILVAEGATAAIGVPLREDGLPFGAVIVGWRHECAPGQHAVTLVQTLADMAAAALIVARRTLALERQRAHTERQAEALAYLNETLQERNEELDAVLDQMADGVIIADRSICIKRANPAADRLHDRPLVGASYGEWSQRFGLRRLDGTPYPEEELPLARATRGETVESAEWLVTRSDGSVFRLLGSAAPLRTPDGALYGAVLVMRDVTERARMAEQLQEATTVKDRFFAQMSHELRTPINAVLGYGTLLQEGFGGELSDEGREMLGRILRSARHLLELVSDVLDISKLEAGKIQIQVRDVDLVTLARETLPTVEPQARAKGLALELRAPGTLPVRTDPARVRQILLNLLSNAVKFTPPDGRVSVILEDLGRQGVALSVEDTGTGIAPEHQEQVFAEFVQVGNRTDGTGLGLAISRRLARLLCGDLRLRSEMGEGSCFTLQLPRDYDRMRTPTDDQPAVLSNPDAAPAATPRR